MTLRKNTTSQSTLQTIKKKLQGKCTTCGGTLPDHIGVCPVWGEEIESKYDTVDDQVMHINNFINDVIKNHETWYEEDV